MRIVCSYQDSKKVWETSETEVLFGRAEDKSPIVLDLSPDQRVSRLHGRIWQEEGGCWIEDLNSSRGTLVNGVEIRGRGRQPLRPQDTVVVGQTTMRIDLDEANAAAGATSYLEHGTILLPEKHHAASGVAIAKDVDATAVEPMTLPPDCAEDSASRRLKMVCDLPFQFATKLKLESLLPAIVDQLVQMIPGGESWALVLRDPATDTLLLKAYQWRDREAP